MSQSPFPTRPRLAEHASVRKHSVRDEDIWVLHDERSGMAYRLGAREWGLLAHADGTRDLDGIIAAASRDGVFTRVALLQSFLEALHEAGLVEDGVAERRPPAERPGPRALDPLPDFRLICDGRGSCCRLYGTIMFRPLEEATARSLLPRVLDAGDNPERAFSPLVGSSPCGATAVGLVDGRCAYLQPDGWCGLHAVGGPAGKPLGCRMFPALFVDDGIAVRVTPAVECACVLASLKKSGEGFPLIHADIVSADKLDAGIHVTILPDLILVTAKRYAPRDELVSWSRVVALAPRSPDTLGVFWSLAAAIETHGLDPDRAVHALTSPLAVDLAVLRAAFASVRERAERRLKIDAAWRSENDLALRAVRWIFAAVSLLVQDEGTLESLVHPPVDSISEAFYLRAGAYGHQFVLGDAPLLHALRDRAARLVLARALPLVVTPEDRQNEPALEYPLALVEATLRAHGLLSRGVLLGKTI